MVNTILLNPELPEKEYSLQNELVELFEKAEVPKELASEYLELYSHYQNEILVEYADQAPSLLLPEDIPTKLPPEVLEMYSKGHSKFYEAKLQELINTYEEWDLLVMQSGMYGGKSSCAFELIDRLREEGVETSLFISASMGEGFVTGRGFGKTGERRNAKKFGGFGITLSDELRRRVLVEVITTKTPVICVDEYTFSNPDEITTLMNVAKAYGKKLILLGLDTNYLGDELPIFKTKYFQETLKNRRTQILDCYSYVNANNTESPPNGKGTIRYLRIGDRWVLDLGIGELVISKENADLVLYFPSIETLKNLLKGNSFFKYILNETVQPNSELASVQRAITQTLIGGK